jgi:hypothetical protein
MTFNSNSNTFKSRHGYNWADLTDNEDNDTPEYNPNINNDKTNQELNLNNLVVDTKTTEEKKTQIYFYGIIFYKEKLTSTFYLQSLIHPEYTGIYIRDGELLHLIDVRLTKQVEMMKSIMIKYDIIYTV